MLPGAGPVAAGPGDRVAMGCAELADGAGGGAWSNRESRLDSEAGFGPGPEKKMVCRLVYITSILRPNNVWVLDEDGPLDQPVSGALL